MRDTAGMSYFAALRRSCGYGSAVGKNMESMDLAGLGNGDSLSSSAVRVQGDSDLFIRRASSNTPFIPSVLFPYAGSR